MFCERLLTTMSESGCISRQKKSRSRHGKPLIDGFICDPGCINCEQGLKISKLMPMPTGRKCSVCLKVKPPSEFNCEILYFKAHICKECNRKRNIYLKQRAKKEREAEQHVYLVS